MNNLEQEILQRRNKAISYGMLTAILPNLILFIAFGSISVLFPALGLLIFYSCNRGNRVVVWFRRFHRKGGKFKFEKILSLACSGIASPITIQDSTIRTNLKGILFILFVFKSFLLLLLVFPLLLLFVYLSEKLGSNFLPAIITISVAAVIGMYFYKIIWKWGHTTLSKETAIKTVDAIIVKSRAAKGRIFGLTILQCEDEFWQDVVLAVLGKADTVIIDISDLNENTRWELAQARSLTSLDSIILSFNAGSDNRKLPDAVKGKLKSIFSENELDRVKVFVYSSQDRRPRTYKNYKIYSQQLRDLMLA